MTQNLKFLSRGADRPAPPGCLIKIQLHVFLTRCRLAAVLKQVCTYVCLQSASSHPPFCHLPGSYSNPAESGCQLSCMYFVLRHRLTAVLKQACAYPLSACILLNASLRHLPDSFSNSTEVRTPFQLHVLC